MAVKLEINANVTGAAQVDNLNKSLNQIGSSTSLADRALRTFNNAAERGRQTIESFGNAVRIAAAAGLGLAVYETQKFVKEVIRVGQQSEILKSRLELAFSSAEEGARAFQYINQYASKTPFSLSEIASALNDIKSVSRTPAELADNLEIAGRIAARFNIPFAEAADGLNKTFRGGIDASRQFKDLNIANLIGLKQGVETPVYEVRQLIEQTFGNGGRLSGSVDSFKGTLAGQVAQIQNSFDKIKQAAGGIVISGLTEQLVRLQKEFGYSNDQLEEFGRALGGKIVEGFKALENGIRLVIENFDKIVAVIGIFLALDVASKVLGIFAAFTSLGATIAQVTGLVKLFNIAWAFSPIGTLAVVITGIVAAFVIWRKEIEKFIEVLDVGLDKLKIFVNAISRKLGGKDVFSVVKEQADQARESIEELGKTVEESLGGTTDIKIETPADTQVNKTPSDTITRDQKDIIPKTTIDTATQLRKIFDQLNIDSRRIGDTISDSWLRGMREGDGLMKSILNSAKALLNSIIEQIVRQTIQLGVEKVFDQLSEKRKQANKEITEGIKEQTNASLSLSNIWSNLTGIFSDIGSSISNVFSSSGDFFSNIGNIFSGSGGGGGFDLSTVTDFFTFNKGGVVPGGAPYTDRVPALLTPGETVIPRGESVGGGGQSYTTYITQNLNTNDLNTALISAIRTNAETVNSILESERNK